MPETVQVELWVMVDSDGEFSIGKDEDTAKEAYSDEYGAGTACRLVRVLVDVPFATPTLRGTAPAEGEAALTVE